MIDRVVQFGDTLRAKVNFVLKYVFLSGTKYLKCCYHVKPRRREFARVATRSRSQASSDDPHLVSPVRGDN